MPTISTIDSDDHDDDDDDGRTDDLSPPSVYTRSDRQITITKLDDVHQIGDG